MFSAVFTNYILWRKSKTSRCSLYSTSSCFIFWHNFWYVMDICLFILSGVFLQFCCFWFHLVFISVKCDNFWNKRLLVFLIWGWFRGWSGLVYVLCNRQHYSIQSVVCWWGGDVWGHWILKLQPKIFNCQDSSHTFEANETFVYMSL